MASRGRDGNDEAAARSAGTGRAVWGTVALTLPSLVGQVVVVVPWESRHPLCSSWLCPLFCPQYRHLPHHHRHPHHPELLSHGEEGGLLGREALVLRYQTHPELGLLSHPHTLVTHLLHHAHVWHWLSNMVGLVHGAMTLDLGWWRTLILIYGGGVAGVAAHMLEWGWVRQAGRMSLATPLPPDRRLGRPEEGPLDVLLHPGRWAEAVGGLYNRVAARLSGPDPSASSSSSTLPSCHGLGGWLEGRGDQRPEQAVLCMYGMDAAVYSLMGAHLVQVWRRYRAARAGLAALPRGSPAWRVHRHHVHDALATGLVRLVHDILLHGAIMSVGAALVTPADEPAFLAVVGGDVPPPLAHRSVAAPLGGYVFGVVAALVFAALER